MPELKWDELLIPWVNAPMPVVEDKIGWVNEPDMAWPPKWEMVDALEVAPEHKLTSPLLDEPNTQVQSDPFLIDTPWVLTGSQWEEQEEIRVENIQYEADERGRKAYNDEKDRLYKIREELRQNPNSTVDERQKAQADIDAHKNNAPKIQQPEWYKGYTPDQVKIPDVNVPWKVDTKAQDLANQAAEEQIKWITNQQAIADFATALSAWNMDEIATITNANPDLRGSFNSMIRQDLKTSAWIDYFSKYSSYNNEQLASAVKNWSIVVWSDLYNTLPEWQRASFTQYQAFETALSTPEDTKKKFASDNANVISTNSTEQVIAWFTASYTREKAAELLNSPEITQTVIDLEDKQNEINAINDELDEDLLRKKLVKQYPWYPAAFINNKIRDERNDLIREKNVLVNEYNSKLWTYQTLRDNANLEIEFLKYEDSQNAATYEAQLDAYTAEQERMTDIAKTEFEAANKIKAEDLKFQRDLTLKQFQADLDAKKETGGIYKTDRDWALIYLKNGVSTKVADAYWDVVFTEDNVDTKFKDTVNFKDWVYYTQRTYTDWSIDHFTSDIKGNSTSNMSVHDLLWGISTTWLQCWEAVNKYVSWLNNEASKDFHVYDSYASKAKYIDADITEPSPWMVAIWNPWVSADGNDYWHIAVVTWEVQENWMVEITDWNSDWVSETKNTRMVSLSSIVNSDGWFYNPNGYTEWQKSFLDWFDGKITWPVKDTMDSLNLTAEDAFSYDSWAITDADKLQIKQATDMISMLKGMQDLGRTDRMSSWLIQYAI